MYLMVCARLPEDELRARREIGDLDNARMFEELYGQITTLGVFAATAEEGY